MQALASCARARPTYSERSAMHLLSVTLALSVLLAAHELRTKGEHEIDGSTVWLTICTPPCSERPAGSQQLTKPPAR
jgi:hypothetical protein